jgi:hypothetical protein
VLMQRWIFFLLFTLSYGVIQAQQPCEQVLFQGRVIDTLLPQPFYNIMVINASSGKGVFGSPNGSFSVYVKPADSVFISVKYYPKITVFVVPDSNCRYERTFYIERNVRETPEVVVTPLKSLQQIKEERESLALRDTRDVTGLEVFQSPITALYEAFSKKEQNRRWIAEQQYRDDQKRIVKELLRNYVSFEIIQLEETDFDAFITFLNVDENFLKTATEMELILFIKDKFEHFKSVHVPAISPK